MPGWLDNPLLSRLEKGLDAASLRQKVLSNNIANVDTPDFKRSDVDFAAVFNEAMTEGQLSLKATSPNHLKGVAGGEQGLVRTDNNTTIRNDGNNVDVEREMANVAENSLYYNGVTRALSTQLELLRMVIQQK